MTFNYEKYREEHQDMRREVYEFKLIMEDIHRKQGEKLSLKNRLLNLFK